MSQITSSITGLVPGGPVETLTGNIGGPVGPSLSNINIVGAGGVLVTGNPGTSTLTISIGGAGFTWNVIAAASSPLVAENGYLANNGAGVVFTLPAVAAVGDVYRVAAMNAGGWTIIERPGQFIQFGDIATTVTTGSLSSTNIGDAVEMVCSVANTAFLVLSSMGNITII